MAVLSKYPSLEVDVIVDGEPLREFRSREPRSQPTTVTRYIEAKSGARFGVKYTLPKGLHKMYVVKVQLSLDGETMRNPIYRNNRFKDEDCTDFLDATHSYKDGEFFEHAFRFSQLDTSEQDQVLDSLLSERLRSVGQITVAFHFIKNISQDPSPRTRVATRLPNCDGVSKNALRANRVSHQGKLDIATPCSPIRFYKTVYAHGREHPFAVFNFKYRSLAIIRSLCVVSEPCSPTAPKFQPEELPSDDELPDLVFNF